MKWDHRVIRSEDGGDVCYALHECFYENVEDTIPTQWTATAVEVMAETRSGLFWVLAAMTEAVAMPVLEICDGRLVEVEPIRELTDDLQKAVVANKEYAEGMA